MDKRGISRQYISVYYLALGGFILLWLLGGTKAIASNTYIQQEYQGRDIALLIDMTQIAEGNVEIRYPAKEGFSYRIGDGKISVKEKIPFTTYYGEDANDTIHFEKEGNLIVVEKNG